MCAAGVGQLYNAYTGKVDLDHVYTGGRYFVYLRHSFITFPSTLTNVEFSNSSTATAPPIMARTGKPPGLDAVAGGQTVYISLSTQYLVAKEDVPKMFVLDAAAPRSCHRVLIISVFHRQV